MPFSDFVTLTLARFFAKATINRKPTAFNRTRFGYLFPLTQDRIQWSDRYVSKPAELGAFR